MSVLDLDVDAALEAVAGDEELLGAVMQVFLDTAPELWLSLSLPTTSDAEAQQIAHRLKGGAGSIGALRLAEAAGTIEQALRQQQPGAWRHLLPELLDAAQQSQVCVRGYLSKL
jgi:HPt (histidine-containing phosphotransfer) domain-containing protein